MMYTPKLARAVLVAMTLVAALGASMMRSPPFGAATAGAPPTPAGAAGNPEDCASCHAEETRKWQSSHHAMAMASAVTQVRAEKSEAPEASPKASPEKSVRVAADVLGDFADVQVSHQGLTANFRTVDGYPVMALTRGKTTTHHIVTYAFGSTPLQQYLTDTGSGHQQVLPFAWDSRDASQGGQRWITLHPQEDILSADRLHWQQPLANWNGMCADCHSTGLTRGYSSATKSFDSEFSQVNVSCASCHSNDPHTTNPIEPHSGAGFIARYPLKEAAAQTVRTTDPAASQRTLEICAGCHSLRSPLVDGIDPTQPYLDQFSPTLPNPTLYFADGQIREEVYVWGSFLQSKMHQQGVTCGNCHDPHSQQLVATGNALCGQCHLAETYDSVAHHHHEADSAQCVNCHMPSRTYMVVDDRRDHSFKVPRPEASAKLGAPDACTGCHTDQSQFWAATQITGWRSETAPVAPQDDKQSTQLWQLSQAGTPLSQKQFDSVTTDEELPELLRASAIEQQARLQAPVTQEQLQRFLNGQEALVTLAAISGTGSLPIETRTKLLTPLLTHRLRAIRIAAANQLRTPPLAGQAKTQKSTEPKALTAALAEADAADNMLSWRGEGAMNRALNLERSGAFAEAISAYQHAISVDPYFEPSYVNLTELYRRQGDTRREQLLYTSALQALPNSPLLRYSYALNLVRQKNPKKAVAQTAKALSIDPANAANAYLHLLLLDNLGETEKGIDWLRANIHHHLASAQVLQLAAKQAQKLGDSKALEQFVQALRATP